MFQGWDDYYLSLGPSAATLIGLMFVVVTLTAGHDRGQVEHGKRLYTSPIVWHLSVVLVLSAGDNEESWSVNQLPPRFR